MINYVRIFEYLLGFICINLLDYLEFYLQFFSFYPILYKKKTSIYFRKKAGFYYIKKIG